MMVYGGGGGGGMVFFWQGLFSAHLWGWLTLLRPCRPSLRVEVEVTACHLHQPPDRFARSAQWPRLPPLSSSLPLAADSLSAVVDVAVAAAAEINVGFIRPSNGLSPLFPNYTVE